MLFFRWYPDLAVAGKIKAVAQKDGPRGTMKLHYLRFKSGSEFLSCYEEMNGKGGLVFPSRAAVKDGETFVLEIKFPALPNRVLIKAEVSKCHGGQESSGESCSANRPTIVETRFLGTEKSKKDFLLAMAKNDERFTRNRPAKRRYRRFPVNMDANWQVKGVELLHRGSIEDLSGGGVFIRTEWTPPEGTDLNLTLYPDDEQGPLRLVGRVAWTKQGSRTGGMGIRFKKNNHRDMVRIRRLIRHMGNCGKSTCPKNGKSHPTVF